MTNNKNITKTVVSICIIPPVILTYGVFRTINSIRKLLEENKKNK